MRTGVCTVQQALTSEAANVVKQALTLSRRRGHTQVTPLHVASAMLASSSSLLRAACRSTHSHPLQCKALELCFNVALNRLPTATSGPLFGPHCPHPSLSNALIAAFKRAQAHQRRGSVENQQQPILALKIEIEQLVISILDDPSVSRVMREAGFSSPQVKANVEQAVSLEVTSQAPPRSSMSKESNNRVLFSPSVFPSSNQGHLGVPLHETSCDDDVTNILDTLMTKRRRNSIIVGESLAPTEAIVKKLMNKFERGDVPDSMRFVQFISLPLSSLKDLSKDEVEQKLLELKYLAKSYLKRGVVLYLGDLKWVSEFWTNQAEHKNRYYCPVEHMVMELRKLVFGSGENEMIWLMGIATFKTYMRCKTGRPSLETIWELHPLAVPVGSLDLSLNLDSNFRVQSGDAFVRPLLETREKQLPFWLQQCREDSLSLKIDDQEDLQVADHLCKEWNSHYSSTHKPNIPEKTFALFPSSSPSISTSSYDQKIPDSHKTILGWPVVYENNRLPKEHQFWNFGKGDDKSLVQKPDLLSNPNSSPNSASSSEVMDDRGSPHRFKDCSSENVKILCDALVKKVPWQKNIIPEIVSTVLQCRSGTLRRKVHFKYMGEKEETWLFFLGLEREGKEKIAKELAKFIFGGYSNYVSIGLSSFSSTRADSSDVLGNKRTRNESGQSYFERFAEVVSDNPHRVIFVEDVDQADRHSQMRIKRAIESGRITLSSGEVVYLEDAITIFSCESTSSVSRACSPPITPACSNSKEKDDDNVEMEENSLSTSLDLNVAVDEDIDDEQSTNDVEILDIVDKQIIFKVQELS